MTKPYEYGPATDPMRLIAELRRDVDRLTTDLTTRSGLQIARASAAFFIPLTATPGSPSGGAYLYYDGSTIRVRTPVGSYSTLPEVPQAAFVDPAPAIVSGDGPASYNPTWGHNMYVGLVDVKDAFNAFRTSVINSGLMSSS